MYDAVSRLRGLKPAVILTALILINSALCQTCAQADLSFGIGARDLEPLDNVATADPTGPYGVGITFETYCSDDRNLTVSIWYPATPEDGSSPYVSSGGIVGRAYEDAPLDPSGGPYPLILFSAGLGAVHDAYYFYLQNLASHGYVVTSAQHLDARRANTTASAALQLIAAADALAGNTNDAVITLYTDWFRETEYAFAYRPQEIGLNLDRTLALAGDPGSRFYGSVDAGRVGMTGHSLGGFFANVVGGGAAVHCDYAMRPGEGDPGNPLLASASPCAFGAVRALPGPRALRDGRVGAVLPLAAPSFLAKDQIARSAAAIGVPVMVMTGDNFTSETTAWIQRAVYENVAAPAYYVQVRDADHYFVADAYGLNPDLPAKGDEDGVDFLDKAAVYMTYSAAFFNLYLKGNTSALDTLHGTYSSYVKELKYRND
ncbi:putative dienelactone hydrolase [Rosellinia necatrix]|uniref:1-alkyl-2-acetylglycerophosphocholine esterase n=1 Tax=Rosellinia necatrix TaxID=77044 RepID=A0A1W2TIG9_ROSNE|nr:putative dienelactone hydrolase [Rosellinia necatrix]